MIGQTHPDWGEEVVACVVARVPLPDAAARALFEAALDAVCLERIARFKRPKVYRFLAELPKNNTGKVLKTVLRETAGDGRVPSATMTKPRRGKRRGAVTL